MVLLPRKNTLLAGIEDVEGVAKTLSSSHAQLALDLTTQIEQEMIPRNAASATLSREKDNIATGGTSFDFGIDARGSGTTTVEPQWGPLMRACGLRHYSTFLVRLVIGAVTNGPFLPGQTVVGASSGGSGKVVSITADGTTELFVLQVAGEIGFTDPETVAVAGGASATCSFVNTGGQLYKPTSTTASTIATSGSWTGSGTIGEVIVGGTSGAKAVLIAGATGTPAGNVIYVEMIVGTGSFAGSETLTGQSSGATISTASSTAETMIWTPSLTMRSNVDGLSRFAVGCRGNLRWRLEAKQPSRFDFSFKGDTHSIVDQSATTGATFPSTSVLQFANAVALIDGTYRVPVGAIELDMGNAVNERRDPNAVSGCRSYVISDRDPTITMDPEMVLSGAYDYYAKWRNATSISLWASLGRTAGNRMTLHVPNLQIVSIADGDRDGLWTASITAKCRRVDDAGDDELYIAMT